MTGNGCKGMFKEQDQDRFSMNGSSLVLSELHLKELRREEHTESHWQNCDKDSAFIQLENTFVYRDISCFHGRCRRCTIHLIR